MTNRPEQRARKVIDAQLTAAGWIVESISGLDLSAARGVAVREVQSRGGPADYMLFVDGKALGIVETKKQGTPLAIVAERSARYATAQSFIPQRWADPLPLAVARKAFGGDPKSIIEELNAALVA